MRCAITSGGVGEGDAPPDGGAGVGDARSFLRLGICIRRAIPMGAQISRAAGSMNCEQRGPRVAHARAQSRSDDAPVRWRVAPARVQARSRHGPAPRFIHGE